jgi:sugar phosphate isomerase/epimerase
MMKLALSIQTPEIRQQLPLTLLSGSLPEKIEKAARLGVDGLEFVTIQPDEVDTEAIRKQLKPLGLRAAGVASGAMAGVAGLTLLHRDPNISQEAYRRLEGLIRLAEHLEAGVVTIGSFRGRSGERFEEQKTRLGEILGQAGDQAARRGVKLAVEPINRYEMDFLLNTEEVIRFCEEINHSAVGVLIDTFHANIEEASRLEPFKSAMQVGKLFYIHIPDNNRLAPGWGMINYQAIVHTLKEIGYEGYLTAELFCRPDPDAAAEQTVTFMREVLSREGLG